MANKKITVVGDGAEEPLTPEEEHQIEVRVDAMLDPTVPDESAQPAVASVASNPVASEAPKPKVTKIVTKFADASDDEPAKAPTKAVESPAPKPAPEPESQPESQPTPEVEAKPKAVPKKIAIKHHDEEAEVDEKPAKSKATTKKAAHAPAKKAAAKKLKIKIVDTNEPDDLASKADAIAAAALAAEEQISAAPSEPAAPDVEPTDSTEPEEEPTVEETSADSDAGAPPLIVKHASAPIGTAPDLDSTPATPAVAPVAKKISVVHDETDEEEQPTPEVEVEVEEIPEEPETIEVEVESSAAATESATPETPAPTPTAPESTSEAKKYRPPEGPLQFKRAEVPIQPHKPGEPRPVPVETDTAGELSEDDALAQAFESKGGAAAGDGIRALLAGILKLLKWLVILGVVAALIAAVAIAVVPQWRHNALHKVGFTSTKKSVSTKTTDTAQADASKPAAVPAGQDVYIAKRGGTYNIYRANADGSQEQLVLSGTGKERSDIVLAPNIGNTLAAFVSTRDGKTQQSLAIVTVSDGAVNLVDSAETVKLIDWFGNKLVYALLNTSTSTTDSSRYQIVSYDVTTKKRVVLDKASYLNDVLSAQGAIYYAVASSGNTPGSFNKVMPDGTGKQVLLSAEVAAITRTGYNDMIVSGVSKWYSYHIGDTKPVQTNDTFGGGGRLYSTSPDGTKSAYIDTTTTPAKLVIYDIKADKESVATTAVSVEYPIHWLSNDTLVYRSTNQDHSIKLGGAKPVKVADVFDAPGISLWRER